MSRDTLSSGDKNNRPEENAQRALSPTGSVSEDRFNTTPDTIANKHWEVILGEFVHLLSLYIVKSQNPNDVHTPDVIFDQLIRHLEIIDKMPDNDGHIFIRRTHCKIPAPPSDSDYFATCGKLLVKANTQTAPFADHPSPPSATLGGESALGQAFKCFSDQGIYSIRIQIPGQEASKIDKLRLALNIVAHFKPASESGASIRFRCYGRALTFSILNDEHGKPDVNLTLTAALNGLSPINARELVKQAKAFHKLHISAFDKQGSPEYVSSYNQIFSVRSLRSQIIKPPVEVNNIPWLEVDNSAAGQTKRQPSTLLEENQDESESAADARSRPIDVSLNIAPNLGEQDSSTTIEQLLSEYVDIDGEHNRVAVQALVADDYETLEPVTIGERLVSLTRFVYALDKQCQDPAVIERILDFFRHRIKKTRDDVLSNIVPQRQGLKIINKGRTVIVGLVHPRLYDLITLVSENVAARRRTAIIKKIAFNFDPCHMADLADGFVISEKSAHHILGILKDCFSSRGSFIRPTFEGRISLMAEFENAIFEILWCFLKETPRRQDRLDFLNALQLLMAKLTNPKRGTQFLLADICQTPSKVGFTDRNAFSLANILLHQENKELYVDINRTPESVLAKGRKINKEVRQYAAWRLDADRVRMLTKLRTLHLTVEETLRISPGERGFFEISFLLALEREALIFLGIVGGLTARTFLREMLKQYGNTHSDIYQHASTKIVLSDIVAQLQIVIRALGRAGNLEDIGMLKDLEENSKALYKLDSHPAHKLKIGQLLKWIPDTITMIRA
jgi:hypothetical protein